MSVYTIKHPVDGFTGDFGGVHFEKGVCSFEGQYVTFPLSMGTTFDEALANLARAGCSVEVDGTDYEKAIVKENNLRAEAERVAAEEAKIRGTLPFDAKAAKAAQAETAKAYAAIPQAVAATKAAKEAEDKATAAAIEEANKPKLLPAGKPAKTAAK